MEQVQTKTQEITANFDKNVDVREFNFKFRASSQKQVDADGNPVMDEKGVQLVQQFPAREIKLNIGTPSVEGLIAIIEAGGKGLDFLLEVAAETFTDCARDILADDENMTAENFPYDQLSWDAIANLPKEVRRGASTIAKEDWEKFSDEYEKFMQTLGLSTEMGRRQASVFKQKLRPIATRKDVLPHFKLLLSIFLQKNPAAGDHLPVIEYLQKANTKYMEAETKSASDMYGLDALKNLAAA